MSPTITQRSTGLLEKFHIVRHELKFDSCVQCAARYSQQELGVNDRRQALADALTKLISAHPALRTQVEGTDVFTISHSLDASQLIEETDEGDLEKVFEAQCLRGFQTGTLHQPLWRVILAPNNVVVFAWHHAIGDGLSGVAFHNALSAALRNQSMDQFALAPALESATSVTPSWFRLISEIANLFIPAGWTRRRFEWTGYDVPQNPTLITHVKFIHFPANRVAQLLTICRKHQTSLTAAIAHLSATALSPLLDSAQFKTIPTSIPVSLRGLTGTSVDAFCDHVSAYTVQIPVGTRFSWDKASELSSAIRLCRPQVGELVGMLKYLFGRFENFFLSTLGKKRQSGVEISNLGVGSGQEMWFAQAEPVTGAALKLGLVSTPIGGLNISVTWGFDTLEEGFVSSFMENLEKQIQEMVTGELKGL